MSKIQSQNNKWVTSSDVAGTLLHCNCPVTEGCAYVNIELLPLLHPKCAVALLGTASTSVLITVMFLVRKFDNLVEKLMD